MYTLKFTHANQIRMAASFNIAEVVLTGDFVPELPKASFQDKGVVSADGHTCYLVEWDTREAAPGFIIWKILEKEKRVLKSGRRSGACMDIKLADDGTSVEVLVWEKLFDIQFTRRIE